MRYEQMQTIGNLPGQRALRLVANRLLKHFGTDWGLAPTADKFGKQMACVLSGNRRSLTSTFQASKRAL